MGVGESDRQTYRCGPDHMHTGEEWPDYFSSQLMLPALHVLMLSQYHDDYSAYDQDVANRTGLPSASPKHPTSGSLSS
jgi:hypothetical protein